MTYSYINALPRDKSNEAMQDFPAPVRARASVMMRENAVASSVMLLDQNATHIEVNAVNAPIVIRWVAATETPSVVPRASVVASGLGANFDHLIPANSFRRFAIPKETGGVGPQGIANAGLGSVYGLYQRLAQINAGTAPASVLIVQY